MPWLDAVEMAFDEEQTKTEVQWMPFSDRRGAREYMNQTQEAQQGASSARFPLEDPAPAQHAQRVLEYYAKVSIKSEHDRGTS